MELIENDNSFNFKCLLLDLGQGLKIVTVLTTWRRIGTKFTNPLKGNEGLTVGTL